MGFRGHGRRPAGQDPARPDLTLVKPPQPPLDGRQAVQERRKRLGWSALTFGVGWIVYGLVTAGGGLWAAVLVTCWALVLLTVFD